MVWIVFPFFSFLFFSFLIPFYYWCAIHVYFHVCTYQMYNCRAERTYLYSRLNCTILYIYIYKSMSVFPCTVMFYVTSNITFSLNIMQISEQADRECTSVRLSPVTTNACIHLYSMHAVLICTRKLYIVLILYVHIWSIITFLVCTPIPLPNAHTANSKT